jgi:predicted ATP-grasp superfamily ATP-dependent carboligase
VIKPIEGKRFLNTFGVKLFTAGTTAEAVEAWERVRSAGFDTIVQELIPSHEGNVYSFFGYLDRDQISLAAVVGRKVREAPRPFGSSTVFVARPNERVEERAMMLLRAVRYHGFAHVELAYDSRIDDFSVIEVNTRVPTWAGIAMTRDFNMAKVAYLDLCGHEQPQIRIRKPRSWVDLIEDVGAGAPRRPVALARFAAPYLRRRSIGALFAVDDPAPAVEEALTSLRRNVALRSRIRRRLRRR